MNLFFNNLLFLLIVLIHTNKQSVQAQSYSFVVEKNQFQKQTKLNSTKLTLFSVTDNTNDINIITSIIEPKPSEKLIQSEKEILLLSTYNKDINLINNLSNESGALPNTKTKFRETNEPLPIKKE